MCKKAPLHPADASVTSSEDYIGKSVESAILKAVFPHDTPSRREFFRRVGKAGALALLGSMFPLEAAKALAADKPGPLEKKALRIAFLPITCSTPIIMAEPMGFYENRGLKGTKVIKATGWAIVRDWTIAREVDCAHMLSPMPLALTVGAGYQPTPFLMPAVENINGQSITLHKRHKSIQSPQELKGFTFCIPFEHSMHNLLLRFYLAQNGIDPDRDVKLRVVRPPEMVANLKAKNVDGFIAPDVFCQRAVYEGIGFQYLHTKDIWPGHPCCAFAVLKEFADEMPNTFHAVFQSIVDATLYASNKSHRKDIARAIAPRNYLNQPLPVVEQVLTGVYPDGLGNMKNQPDSIDFDPFPWRSMAVWILTQMKRWGYIKGDIDYKKIAEQVYLSGECADLLQQRGIETPDSPYKTHTIGGKTFDPNDPEGYLRSFSIKKA